MSRQLGRLVSARFTTATQRLDDGHTTGSRRLDDVETRYFGLVAESVSRKLRGGAPLRIGAGRASPAAKRRRWRCLESCSLGAWPRVVSVERRRVCDREIPLSPVGVPVVSVERRRVCDRGTSFPGRALRGGIARRPCRAGMGVALTWWTQGRPSMAAKNSPSRLVAAA